MHAQREMVQALSALIMSFQLPPGMTTGENYQLRQSTLWELSVKFVYNHFSIIQ